MDKFLNMNNPFFQFLEKVADFIIVNLLTIFCSVPIITAGAAITANHKVMQNFVAKTEQPVVKTYFRSFFRNFKQATLTWLFALFAIAFLLLDLFLVYTRLTGNLATVMYVVLAIACVISLGTVAFVLPLIARYENTLKQHLRNGLFLAIGNLPKTIIMLALYALPIILAFISMTLFVQSIFIWSFIGMSVLVYLETRLVWPIFCKIEESAEEAKALADAETPAETNALIEAETPAEEETSSEAEMPAETESSAD